MKYKFEPFQLDLAQEKLTGPEGDIALRPQAFALLKLLVERAPELLTRDEILDEVWGRHALSVNSLPQVIAEIRSALGDSAANSRFVATKHRRGYHFVADVETVDEGATPVVAASEPPLSSAAGPDEASEALQPSIQPPHTGTKRWLTGIAAVVAVVVAGFVWLQQKPNTVTLLTDRPSVAVLGFRNLSDRSELGWLDAALADLIGLHLGGGEDIRVVPGEAVARAQISLELSRWDGLDQDTLTYLNELTKADYLVLGSYVPAISGQDEGVSITVRVQSTTDGSLIATMTESTSLAGVTSAAQSLGNKLRGKFGVPSLQSDQQRLVARSLPNSTQARVAYFTGLERHRALDLTAAIEHLEEATVQAPDSAAVRYALANALVDAGYLERALQQARLAAVNSGQLSTRERLEISALAARLGQDWPDARRDYQALFSFFPDEPSYGYRLLETEIEMGDLGSADQTLNSLGAGIEGAGQDPVFLLASAQVAAAQGNPNKHAELATESLSAAQRLQSVYLQAAARQSLAKALVGTERQSEAQAEFETAGTLFQSLNARKSYADVLLDVAELSRSQAQYDRAESTLMEALEIYTDLGFITGRARANLALGNVAFNRGGSPRERIQTAAALFQESGDYRGLADAKRNLAIASDRGGDPATAVTHFQEALTAYERIGDNRGQAATLVSYGGTLARLTRWDEAESALQDALTQFELVKDLRGQAFALSNLAGVAANLGRTDQVASLNERALLIYREMGANDQAARILYNQALASRRRGELQACYEKLVEAEGLARAKGAMRIRLAALTTLADVSIKMGNTEQARDWLLAGQALDVTDHLRQALFVTAAGRLALLAGDWAGARTAFEEARALREGTGSRAWALASELDLAELDLAEGKPVRAEESARRLASEFQAMGEILDQAKALMTEAHALIFQNRPIPTAQRLSQTREILRNRPDFELNLRLSLLDGMAAAGNEPAIERLAWVSEEARDHSYLLIGVLSEFELIRRYESTGDLTQAGQLRESLQDWTANPDFSGLLAHSRSVDRYSVSD